MVDSVCVCVGVCAYLCGWVDGCGCVSAWVGVGVRMLYVCLHVYVFIYNSHPPMTSVIIPAIDEQPRPTSSEPDRGNANPEDRRYMDNAGEVLPMCIREYHS